MSILQASESTPCKKVTAVFIELTQKTDIVKSGVFWRPQKEEISSLSELISSIIKRGKNLRFTPFSSDDVSVQSNQSGYFPHVLAEDRPK